MNETLFHNSFMIMVMVRLTIEIHKRLTHYWVWNPGKLETVVFIHGFGGNHKGITTIAEHLSDYRVVVPDLPGFGVSDDLREKHTFRHYAIWLEDFCQALKLQNIHLAGHSYGASIAVIHAALFPRRSRSLTLIMPVSESSHWQAQLGKMFYSVALILPRFVRHAWLKSHLVDDITDMLLLKKVSHLRRAEIMAGEHRTGDHEMRDRVMIEGYLSLYDTPFYRLARKIKAPTLILGGEFDQISPPEIMRKLERKIHDCTLVILAGAGHLEPLEEPGLVAHRLRDFIASH